MHSGLATFESLSFFREGQGELAITTEKGRAERLTHHLFAATAAAAAAAAAVVVVVVAPVAKG